MAVVIYRTMGLKTKDKIRNRIGLVRAGGGVSQQLFDSSQNGQADPSPGRPTLNPYVQVSRIRLFGKVRITAKRQPPVAGS